MSEVKSVVPEIRIREKLRLLTAHPRASVVFGAGGDGGHGYRELPTLGAEEVARLEDSFGVTLPDELRLFLTSIHGGGPGPGYGFFLQPDETRRRRRAQPFSFDEETARSIIAGRLSGTDRWASAELPKSDDPEDDDWPPGPGFLPIAHHGCGVYDVIVVSGEQRGRIWCCDMRWCPVFDMAGRHLSFLEWYEDWLDSSLRTLAASSPKKGE